MAQVHFQDAKEVQLHQLPEGTEIQVRPVPLAFAYKKLGGRWIPIESHPSMYMPLVYDQFPAGSIAIHPSGIGYVKGFTGCPHHAAGTQCVCTRPLCWLRVGPVHRPPPRDDIPAYTVGPEEDIATGAVAPAAQDFHDGFPEEGPGLPNVDAMEGYPIVSYPPTRDIYDHHSMGHGNGNFSHYGMSGVEEPSFSAAPGRSDEIHDASNDVQLSGAAAMQQPHPGGGVDDELQEVQPMVGPGHYTIHFNLEGGGVPLTSRDINTLDNESLAFGHDVSLGIKASFRFKFRYWQNIPDLKDHADKRKQVNVRHGRKDGTPISLRALARLVLSELTAEMKTMTDLNHPLLHLGAPVKTEELVLVRVERIKPGTLQPVFVLRR